MVKPYHIHCSSSLSVESVHVLFLSSSLKAIFFFLLTPCMQISVHGIYESVLVNFVLGCTLKCKLNILLLSLKPKRMHIYIT